MRGPNAFRTIDEPRLSDILRERLTADGRWPEGRALSLRTPPIGSNDPRLQSPQIQVRAFPIWFTCDDPTPQDARRRRMVRTYDPSRPVPDELRENLLAHAHVEGGQRAGAQQHHHPEHGEHDFKFETFLRRWECDGHAVQIFASPLKPGVTPARTPPQAGETGRTYKIIRLRK